jgi:hypothetical protein
MAAVIGLTTLEVVIVFVGVASEVVDVTSVVLAGVAAVVDLTCFAASFFAGVAALFLVGFAAAAVFVFFGVGSLVSVESSFRFGPRLAVAPASFGSALGFGFGFGLGLAFAASGAARAAGFGSVLC